MQSAREKLKAAKDDDKAKIKKEVEVLVESLAGLKKKVEEITTSMVARFHPRGLT